MSQELQLSMGELRERLLGFDRDGYLGRYYLRVRGLGRVFINRNVVKRFGGVDGVINTPSNWVASMREWQGEYWLGRVSSPSYVDVPANRVLDALRDVVGVLTSFGRWESRVWVEEGAEYGSVTGIVGKGSMPSIGDFVGLIRVTWGSDGFTAFKVYTAVGILQCMNGLVLGFSAFRRIFHTRLSPGASVEEKVNEVLARVKRAVAGARVDPSKVEELAREQAPVNLIEELGRRFGDFERLYNEYRAQYGDTMLAVYQALGYIATHGSARRGNQAVSTMLRLLGSTPQS
ncbi:MAG: hypothetical protein RQ842_10495 [Vulcanisaeta sp.]|nr:hypothetical protein [Vulcanisaeta sp.]